MVPRPDIRGIPEIMVYRILMFMWPLGPLFIASHGIGYACRKIKAKITINIKTKIDLRTTTPTKLCRYRCGCSHRHRYRYK